MDNCQDTQVWTGCGRQQDKMKLMAKEQKQRANKEPGRIKQMVQIYQNTKQHDRNLTLTLLASFLLPVVVSVLLAWLLGGGVFGWILWPVTGILVGVLLVMIVLGRRAESVAYRQLEGRPGAVGAVINGALRRSWRGSEVPIAMNRSQDAVYRVVGRGGVVLIAEGPAQRTRQLVAKEETQLKRMLPGVPITTLQVGPDEDAVPLHKLSRTLIKLKPVLRKPEITTVFNRLMSMKSDPIGIPKGVDPMRIRGQRPR